jgi:NAD(P)-dependent dehydrogenase (short-subunit alcohol dehydrogenase family)
MSAQEMLSDLKNQYMNAGLLERIKIVGIPFVALVGAIYGIKSLNKFNSKPAYIDQYGPILIDKNGIRYLENLPTKSQSKNIFGAVRSDFDWNRIKLKKDSLTGKKVAVIGGTNGIGRAIARALISKGAQVIVVGRTFLDQDNPSITFIQADLSCLKTAQRLAREQLPAESLDMIIMTQGIFVGKDRLTNNAGIELDMAISYLSRMVICNEIVARIGTDLTTTNTDQKIKPRIFIMGFPGSERHAPLDDLNSEKDYSCLQAHYNGVVGNEALVLAYADRYPKVNFYGLNPGLIKSNILSLLLASYGNFLFKMQQTLIGWFYQSADQYAERLVPLLVSPDIESYSGSMFGRFADPIYSNPVLLDKGYLSKFMEESEKLIERGQSIKIDIPFF